MTDLSTAPKELSSVSSAPLQMAWLDRRRLFFIVLVVAAIIYSQAGLWKRPVRADRAIWDYFAQVIARGGVPYRDVVEIKTPLSAYISAGAILAGRPFGLRDVIAIRLVYIFLAALTVAFTFLVAHCYFRSRRIALLAATVMLAFNSFAILSSSGTQPKTLVMLFGLMALWAVMRERPFAAGLFGMLSMLSWQPGLLFAGVALLAFSRHLTRWRDGKALKVIAGAAVPLVIFVMYLWMAGGLRDFYLWCFHYNYTVYGPRESRSLQGSLEQLRRLIHGNYSSETIYFYLAVAGTVIAFVKEGLRTKADGIKGLLDRAPHHAMLIAPLAYFAFCAVNLQGAADLFPLLPFVGIFAAVAAVFTLDRAALLVKRLTPRLHTSTLKIAAFVPVLGIIFFSSVADTFFFEVERVTLQDQEEVVEEMRAHLEPGDKIFVHGQAELLVLSRLPNASKYFFFDRGKDAYLDQIEPGGF
ncbi:MAG: DolP-mannose mannosyltransferase, partial [Blastocatellia bacterium]|nr:DolP-mannose mannosyltransferase [Blastocatellia bacterium]